MRKVNSENRNISSTLNAPTTNGRKILRFAVCADPHQDIMHDGEKRLTAFINQANEEKVDFIIHLGDFCRPYKKNLPFLKIWNNFDGHRFHTFGNHDNDGGFTWKRVLKYWAMPFPYYSFDLGGWHFVVLDGNEKNPKSLVSGYPRYISKKQIKWLYKDINKTPYSTILFSHQSLEDKDEGIENHAEVRSILEKLNREAGWNKVCASFSGHSHVDFATQIREIHYIQINSMSNYWLGKDYQYVRYSSEIDKEFPWIKYTAPYKDALFAMVTLFPESRMEISGIHSEFVGPTPWEVGFTEKEGTLYNKGRVVPSIADRSLKIDGGRNPANRKKKG